VVEEFRERIRGVKSGFTVKYYTEMAQRFVNYVGEKDSYGPEDLARYMAYLERKGYPLNTRIVHFYAIQCFYRVMGFNMGYVRAPRPEMPRPHVWSREEVMRLLRTVDKYGNAMERALLWLAAYTGARRIQLLRLRVRDYDPRTGILHIPRTLKGDVDRSVQLPEHVKSRLYPWWARQYKEAGPNARLFPISETKATLILREYAKMAGVYRRRCGFHSFRRWLTTELYRAGLGLRELQDSLGWATPTMPMRYVHLLAGEVESEFKKAHPLEKSRQA